LLRECIGGVSIVGFIGLLFWLGCAFLFQLMKWCCDIADAVVSEQACDDKDDGAANGRGEAEDCLVAIGSSMESNLRKLGLRCNCRGDAASEKISNLRRGQMSKQKYYAVRRGRTPGVYFTWADCSREVIGYSGAKHKGFGSLAEAEEYLFQVGDF